MNRFQIRKTEGWAKETLDWIKANRERAHNTLLNHHYHNGGWQYKDTFNYAYWGKIEQECRWVLKLCEELKAQQGYYVELTDRQFKAIKATTFAGEINEFV